MREARGNNQLIEHELRFKLLVLDALELLLDLQTVDEDGDAKERLAIWRNKLEDFHEALRA